MGKIELYRTYIQQVLREYVEQASSHDDHDEVETELVFDTERDHYQVVHTGWKN